MLNLARSAGYGECQANITSFADNFVRFAIGEIKATGGSNPYTWFRLYPKKEDNSGWWSYKGGSGKNTKLSIHSKAKSGVNDRGIIVVNNVCWGKLSEIIRSSETFETIKAEKFAKGIFGKPYDKVKIIGTLAVM